MKGSTEDKVVRSKQSKELKKIPVRMEKQTQRRKITRRREKWMRTK